MTVTAHGDHTTVRPRRRTVTVTAPVPPANRAPARAGAGRAATVRPGHLDCVTWLPGCDGGGGRASAAPPPGWSLPQCHGHNTGPGRRGGRAGLRAQAAARHQAGSPRAAGRRAGHRDTAEAEKS